MGMWWQDNIKLIIWSSKVTELDYVTQMILTLIKPIIRSSKVIKLDCESSKIINLIKFAQNLNL